MAKEDDSHDMVAVAGTSYDAMDLEYEKKDGEDNHNYHHVIGRIANMLESMDLDAM